jgi:hypothetical protein
MKPFNFPPDFDWNQMLQLAGALMTRAKKSRGMKILKNRGVDSMGVGVGLVMAGWWVLQFSGLPQPLQEFVNTGHDINEFRTSLARVEGNTQRLNMQMQDLSFELETYKDQHAREYRQIKRDLLKRNGDGG